MEVLISGAGLAGLSPAPRPRQRGLGPMAAERSPRPHDRIRDGVEARFGAALEPLSGRAYRG